MRFAGKLIVAVLLLSVAQTPAADPPPVTLPLTQFEVLDLVLQRKSDEDIIAQLHATRSTFKLTESDVTRLRSLGVSNRVIAAMIAPLPAEPAPAPRPVSPVVQAAAITPAPTPAQSHLGTWVREVGGARVTLRFTDKRLFATLTAAGTENGTRMEATFRLDADYAVGPDGQVFGVVTGTDYTPPKEVDATDLDWPQELTRLNGMPFCFRFRIDDGVLSASDLRCELSSESLLVLGRYMRSE